jgi:hypothetical protein
LLQALRDEEIEDLAGLEGSLTTQDDGVAKMGAKEQLSHAEASHVDPSAAGTSRPSADEQV